MKMKMKRRILVIGLVALLSVFLTSCGQDKVGEKDAHSSSSVESANEGRTHDEISGAVDTPTAVVINIENYSFGPNEITVAAGTKVTWVNKDKVPHTATADDKAFDSGILTNGKEFAHTFSTPGTYAYHCVPHPAMKAKVVVK